MQVIRPDPSKVRVWAVLLDGVPPTADEIAVLGDVERSHVDRFRFALDRIRYAWRHIRLRRLLGAYLGLEPGAVAIMREVPGKATLESAQTLAFSPPQAGTPVAARSSAFLELWTRKVAAVKVLGTGLLTPLTSVPVLDSMVHVEDPSGKRTIHFVPLSGRERWVEVVAGDIPLSRVRQVTILDPGLTGSLQSGFASLQSGSTWSTIRGHAGMPG